MTAHAIEVAGLVKRYGSRTAVDRLSFTADGAVVTALLGPNGAGKTTTVEICEGFRRADAGSVRVLGCDPQRDRRRLEPRVGAMLQSADGVPSGARAHEVLRLVAALHAHPIDPAALLDRLGLGEVAGTTYRNLSGGQRRRLSLAMAVVGRPEVVFLDEPTAGLDPQARHAAWDIVGELRDAGVAVVLTTHHMDEAERLADHIVIMDGGRAVASGSPTDLTSGGARHQLRFEARPGLAVEDLRAALPVDSSVQESPEGHYLVEGKIAPDVLATVTAWCAARDVLPGELRVESRTLEDVFLELTGREMRP